MQLDYSMGYSIDRIVYRIDLQYADDDTHYYKIIDYTSIHILMSGEIFSMYRGYSMKIVPG